MTTASGPTGPAGSAVGTGRRGRPQRPLDTTVPALAELAQELRELRATAGLTLDNLYAVTHWSKGALSAATTGRDLPRWDLVKAWVTACDPDANLDLWQARHRRARAQYERTRLVLPAGRPPAGRTAPAPRVPDSPAGPRPSSLERDAWRTLAPDRRPWGVAAHPAPIPLRFGTVGPDFTDTGSDAADLTGHYEQIGEIFALTETRRLLVLGDRGSGKTQLARHLGTRLLTADGGGSASVVPVLVSLRGWRPERGPDSLLAWIADALTGCTTEDVRTLLGRHRLLPILDDFDSLTLRQRGRALYIFNQLPQQAPFVLVSGWAEFTRTVEKTDTVIAGSAGVRLLPVGVGDLDGWIQRSSRSRTKEQDWAPVLAALADRPDLPAATVLADPTLAGAARLLYTDGRAVPAELVAEGATVEALEIRLVQHLFGSFPPYRQHGGIGGHQLQEQHRHRALHLLARREQEEEAPVGDLRVLYRGRRPSRRRAGVQAALLSLLSWVFLGFVQVQLGDGTSTYSSSGSPSPVESAALVPGVIIGVGWYVYLRHRLDGRAARTDPLGRVRSWLLRSIPAGVALVLAMGVGPGADAERLSLVVAASLLAGAVWLAEQASRRPAPHWFLAELAVLPVLMFVALLGQALGALPVLLPVLLGVTVTGHWLRAVLTSRFALWGLYPGVVLGLLADATDPDVLRSGRDGWSFTHPAVARWYRKAAVGSADAENTAEPVPVRRGGWSGPPGSMPPGSVAPGPVPPGRVQLPPPPPPPLPPAGGPAG
ncbi:helix-turn-helix domain-containing protein [Streptomyces sp. NPDC040724]|uniref:helix-turn-helix domain-containing protein n=1 Tax=Streptomyces sp. NPDC040724 TaxID=3155612 RepID=UPI0034075C00